MGEFHGFVVDPIKRDVFHFENCSFKTLVGLKVSDADIDFEGMTFEVERGPKFIQPGDAVEMPVFPNSRGGVRKEIPQLSLSKCRVR